MKILVGCELSGVVRNALLSRGYDARSCDLRPAADGSKQHIIGDVREVMVSQHWDMLIAHPPCTRLCNSGSRWIDDPPLGKTLKQMQKELREGAALFSACLNSNIKMVAVENPVMHHHAKKLIEGYFPHTQSVHPWWFGDDEEGPDNVKKRTLWWLKGLPKLRATGSLDGSTARAEIHEASPGEGRADMRSKSFPGMAAAIADQWGRYTEMILKNDRELVSKLF